MPHTQRCGEEDKAGSVKLPLHCGGMQAAVRKGGGEEKEDSRSHDDEFRKCAETQLGSTTCQENARPGQVPLRRRDRGTDL